MSPALNTMTIIKSNKPRRRVSDILALIGLLLLAAVFGYLIIKGRIPGSA